MKEIVLGVLLVIQGGIDFKNKEIPLWLSLLGGIIGVIFCVTEGRDINEILFACMLGLGALLFSKMTKEVIGYGDGILLVVMGLYLSLENLMSVVMLAFGIAGIVALVLLVVFRKNGHYEIPFVPFLSLAYVLEYCIALGEVSL